MELNNIIFSFLLSFVGFFFIKYLILSAKKSKFNLLSDDQFKKPQAFHTNPTLILGGITFFSLLILVFFYLFYYKNIFLIEYISFCSFFFFLGLIDDLKINIRPKFRLLAMIGLLVTLVIFNRFYIEQTGLEFLNNFLRIDIFALMFVCICFLFIINGANLIDGFNGLLSIHASIIFIVLFVINMVNENNDLMYVLFYVNLLIVIFIKFNFPKAQIFLGDSGAYLIGTFIAVSTINTSILNPHIAPFFFCILLFYLFIEVFFSFFRKIIFAKQSPLLPDNKHFHMILYKFFIKKKHTKSSSNYKVSIYMNMIYLLLIIPGIIFMSNGIFCRYYFFSLLFIYLYFYKILYEKVK
mgnify:CR=1 FL=1